MNKIIPAWVSRLLRCISIVGLVPLGVRADLLVIANPANGNYNGIQRYDQATGARLGEFYATNEGWNGMCRGPAGNCYVIGNLLGSGMLYGIDSDGLLVRAPLHAGAYAPGDLAYGPDQILYNVSYGTKASIRRFHGITGADLGVLVPEGSGGTTRLSSLAVGPDGNLYANSDLGVVRFRTDTGAFIDVFVPAGSNGVAVDSAITFGPDRNLYVTSVALNSVKRFNGTTGAYLDDFVAAGSGGLSAPSDLKFGPDGRLYVASRNSHQILRYDGGSGVFAGVFVDAMPDAPQRLAFGGAPEQTDTVWFDDALPAGATAGATKNDGWNWVTTASDPSMAPEWSDAPISGTRAHRTLQASGLREHYFNFGAPLAIAAGDVLYVQAHIWGSPGEIMLSWNDGSTWEHRAYWGANAIQYGTNGTDSRRNLGRIDGEYDGRWVRLEIPASLVGLEGQSVHGMSFSVWEGGTVTWDRAGKVSFATGSAPAPIGDISDPVVRLTSPGPGDVRNGVVPLYAEAYDNVGVVSVQFSVDGDPLGAPLTAPPYTVQWDTTHYSNGTHWISVTARDAAGHVGYANSTNITVQNLPPRTTVWYEGAFPRGAQTGTTGSAWTWINTSSYSGKPVLESSADAGRHEHYFNFAWDRLTLAAGEKFYIWVRLPWAGFRPRQIQLSFCTNNWEHRAYWGERVLRYGTDGTAAQYRVGDVPTGTDWIRLEVPAEAIGVVDQAIQGFSITLYDGAALFDQAGKFRP